MKGNPKYNLGEKVTFHLLNRNNVDVQKIGTIYIVDKYGTFEDPTDVSYDILSKDEDGRDILYKHVSEKAVLYSMTKYENKE